MGAIRKDRFVKQLTADPKDTGTRSPYGGTTFNSRLKRELAATGMVPASSIVNVVLNEESAVRIYDQLREYVAIRGYYPGKYLRPWTMDPELYSDLDENQPWWGFEFETGYTNQDTRAEVIRRTWDELNNTCFDAEGEGGYRSEITFAPQEISKYEDRTAEAVKFMKMIDELRETHTNRTDQSGVGCHLNISVPGLNAENYVAVTQIMNNTISAIPRYLPASFGGGERDTRLEFFGRERLYGLFYQHASTEEQQYDAHGNPVPRPEGEQPKTYYWLEGKLFRTTYNYARFEQYMAVCDAITRCMQWLVKQDPKTLNLLRNRSGVKLIPVQDAGYNDDGEWAEYKLGKGGGAYFKNFIKMVLTGEEPEIENWTEAGDNTDDGSLGIVRAFRLIEREQIEEAEATPPVVEEEDTGGGLVEADAVELNVNPEAA